MERSVFGGRPHGEERRALAAALLSGPGTTREIAARACVGVDVARETLNNMVRASSVIKLTTTRVPGCKRPVPVYSVPLSQEQPSDALAAAVGVWWLDTLVAEAAS
jgi:hypothetical protein